MQKSGVATSGLNNSNLDVETCLRLANWSGYTDTSFVNGSFLRDNRLVDNSSCSPEIEVQGAGIFLSSVLFLCHFYCIYFYFVRLKAKGKSISVSIDFLYVCIDFLYVVVGCAAMSVIYVWRIAMLSLGKLPASSETFAIFLHALSDCCFILSNASASYRLMLVSFNLATGYSKGAQEKLRRMLLFVACSCGVMALSFLGGFSRVLDDPPKSFQCGLPWEFEQKVSNWPSWLRVSTFCVSICTNLLSFYFAVRNFDIQVASSGSSVETSLVERNGSGDLIFGRHRRLLVLSSAFLTTIFWLLVVFIVELPQRMASEAEGAEYKTFSQACTDGWMRMAIIMSLSPVAPSALIRAFAFPICSMIATRSFETGSKSKKLVDSLHNLRSKVVYKDDGTATYRLETLSTAGRSARPVSSLRFSANEDFYVTAQ